MLTISKIGVAVGDRRAAVAAAGYALERGDSPRAFARDGGEVGDAEPSAVWLGSGSAVGLLGLERGQQVVVEQLALALEGRHAVTGEQVRWPGFRRARDRDGQPRLDERGQPYSEAVVNSFDLCFSAPKSVSVLWWAAGAELRAGIERAMFAAANATLEHVTKTKPVLQGTGRPGRGFVASAALHVMARTARGEAVPSPQLHLHCHLVGVEDEVGNLRTPGSEALFKRGAPREGGAVFRAVAAQELRRLGFQMDWGTGRNGRYFEILGVARGLCDRMSGRSRDVAARVEELEAATGGPVSGRAQALAALETRADKDPAVSAAEVIEVNDAQLEEFGFGAARVEQLQTEPRPQPSVSELQAALRAAILERMWADGPTVSIDVVPSMAYELAPMGLSLEEAGAVLVQMQRDGELIALDGDRVTSREIRAAEEHVLKVALEGARAPARPVSESARAGGIAAAERKLGQGKQLDPEQKDAVGLLTGGAGWACLTGLAGTGKGPVLQAVAEAHRLDGWQVIACAADGATTQRVGQQVGAEAYTLAGLFARVRVGAVKIDERTLILIDEASKQGLRSCDQLAYVCERGGLEPAGRPKVIPIGDIGQLGAIECPGMFQAMLEHPDIRSARLEEVRRHLDPADPDKKHPWLEEYLKQLYRGDTKGAVKRLRQEGAITMHPTPEAAMDGLVERWAGRRREHDIAAQNAILIVHGSNADVDRVNELAQAKRYAAGELAGEGVVAPGRGYRLYVNDVVMMRAAPYQRNPSQPGRRKRVENGTFGIVTRVDAQHKRVWVAFDEPGRSSPRVVEIDLAELASRPDASTGDERVPELWLAYAGHPFPIQGATYDYVGSLWGHRTQNREASYTDNSRARFFLDVHTDRVSTGWDGTDDDRFERLAKRIKKSANKLASITFGKAGTWVTPVLTKFSDLPPPKPQPARQRAAGEEPGRDAIRVPDPLEDYATLLGPARLEEISRRADARADEISQLDEHALRAQRDQGRESLARLDRPAALEVLRIEQWVAAGQDEPALSRLVDRELELLSQNRHPTEWIKRDGDSFARAIAAERQLALRHELRIRDETDAAIHDPPAHVTDMIGAPPDQGAAERAEWETLARELVRAHLADEASPALDRGLRERIDAHRQQRSLEPPDHTQSLNRTDETPGIDL